MRLEVFSKQVRTANSFHMLGLVHHKITDFTSAIDSVESVRHEINSTW